VVPAASGVLVTHLDYELNPQARAAINAAVATLDDPPAAAAPVAAPAAAQEQEPSVAEEVAAEAEEAAAPPEGTGLDTDTQDILRANKEGMNLSRMRRVIKVVEHYAKRRGVWKPLTGGSDYWNGETVTKVWDGVWKDMLPLLATWTSFDDGREDSDHKSRVGDISWRTCHNKLYSTGVYKSLGI
jgi:hypothetical protein